MPNLRNPKQREGVRALERPIIRNYTEGPDVGHADLMRDGHVVILTVYCESLDMAESLFMSWDRMLKGGKIIMANVVNPREEKAK